MGYIQDLEQELNEMLSDLPEERQKKIIRFIKERVLESYKNGIMSAKLVKAEKEAERKARKYKNREVFGVWRSDRLGCPLGINYNLLF